MNYHIEELIKAEGIPHGRVMLVDGAQGVGKTSLIAALMRADYAYHAESRRQLAILHYKTKGLNLTALPSLAALNTHLYYSNVEIALRGSLKTATDKFKTHNVTADDICLPDGINPAVYFPWGSVIFIQEASDRWHAYDWNKLARNIRPWLKYIRQANLTLILDTHNDSDIAKQLRELATDELYVDSHFYKPPRFFKLVKARTTWYFNWSYPQAIRAAERRGDSIKSYSQKVSFRIKGDVYNAYDSYGGEALFLRGIYDYGFAVRQHPKLEYASAVSIENYCKHNSIVTDVAREAEEKAKNTKSEDDEKAG